MKKTHLPTRLLAVVLAFALLFGFAAPVGATGAGEREITFRQVDNSAVSVDSGTELPEEEPSQPDYADTDVVRVSIFLEKDSTTQAGYSTREIARNGAAMIYRAGLQAAQCAMTATIERATGEKLDVVWNMTLAANAISANVEYGQIAAIEKLPGVAEVVLETRYEPQEAVTDATNKPNMVVSTQMTGTNVAWQSGYTGAGMRVAIIDTGLDTDHQSVAPGALEAALRENAAEADMNYEEYLKSLDLLDEEELARVLPQLNASKRYEGLTAGDLYINLKAPFGFNYVDSSLDVIHDNDGASEHGSHVAGIAAANRLVEQDGVCVSAADAVGMVGNAPDAQIIVMKVFGQNGGAYDSDYMAALEDAILLGCDSVNMSLGSSLSGESGNETYAALLDSLTKTDTVLSTSMGNSGYWAMYAHPNQYLFLDDVNCHTGGSPGSYTNTFTVASVENDGLVGNAFTMGERDFVYTELLYKNLPFVTLDTSEDGSGTEYDYVMITGEGYPSDYNGVDVNGKIVVCRRGSLSFDLKAGWAVDAGAAALIVYNDRPGVLYMDLSSYKGPQPCVSATKAVYEYILETATEEATEAGTKYYTGKLTVGDKTLAIRDDAGYLTMSDFSSWGVPGDLSLKPEITAPGGNIYSINGGVEATDKYELMSGTSMAAPQIAGISALVLQHIQTRGLSQAGLTDRALAQSVMMSTATPLKDGDGRFYPVIQQGAGLVNTAAATSFDSYVLVDGCPDGKVKAELGDDPNREGVYSFRFEIHNITDTQKAYALSADVFTQDFFVDYANYKQNEEQVALFMDTQTTPLTFDALWTADGRAIGGAGELERCDFDGDGDVDTDDGQALLDYATGLRDAIEALDCADADLDGDVDTYDAHLFLSKLNGQTVLVPAGGSVQVAVTIRLTGEAKAHLDEYYKNGAYVQAYVFADAVADDAGALGTSHSIPMLAFYGNWSDASMYTPGVYQTFETGEDYCIPYRYYTDTNTFLYCYEDAPADTYVFGGNPVTPDACYMPQRNAINNETGAVISKLKVSVIRNATATRYTVTNTQTGEVLEDVDMGRASAAAYQGYIAGYQPDNYILDVDWDPKGFAEGDQVELCLTLAPDYYVNDDGSVRWDELGRGASLKTPVTIDNTAPEMNNIYLDLQNDLLKITATDNQYVAAVSLYNDSGRKLLAQAGSHTEARPGETLEYALDVSEADGKDFLVQVEDYAMNTSTYAVHVDLGDLPVPQRIAFRMGKNNNKSYWVGFDQSSDWPLKSWMPSDRVFYAATLVNHIILAATSTGELYAMPEADPTNMTFVAELGVLLTDMAYNPQDGQVYGVAEGNLVTVDKLTGDVAAIGAIGVNTNTLACDRNGVFYSHKLGTGEVYSYTLDTLAEPALLTEIPDIPTSSVQAMEIDPNTGLLCWTSHYIRNYGWEMTFGWYFEIDTATGEYTKYNDFMDQLSCLVIPENGDSGSWTKPTEEVRGIRISRDALSLLPGATGRLSANVTPWTAIDRSIVWTSSDPAVATVDEEGLVTGVGVGTCQITATSHLDANFSASCTVTVDLARVTLEGVVRDADGDTKLFTWNVETDDTFTAGPVVDVDSVSSTALDTDRGDLYVMDSQADVWSMHRVDPATGVVTASAGNPVGAPMWDMVYSHVYSTEESVRINAVFQDYVLTAKDPMALDNSAFDLFSMLTSVGARYLSAITTKGQEPCYDEESGQTVDAEHLVLMDNHGGIWNFWIYENEKGTMSGILDYCPSNLQGLEFPRIGRNMYCSLVAGEDGYLYFCYCTGKLTQLYRLCYDAVDGIYKADLLGAMGDDVWPASIYAVRSNAPVETEAAEPAGTGIHVESVPITAEALATPAEEETLPGGALNAVSTSAPQRRHNALPVELLSVEHKTDCAEKTVTLTLTADGETTNGLYTVSYDASLLTLLDKSGSTELASFAQEDGRITFGYAGKEAVPAGTALATLTFQAQADTEAAFTVTLAEENDRHPGTVEDVTLTVPEHDYVQSVVPATCEAGGYTLHTCKNCGHSYVDEETEALGHDWSDWTVETAAGCDSKGAELRTCRRCGETETRETEAAGHSFTVTVVAPTCVKDGYTLHTCTVCGYAFRDAVTPANSDHCPSKAFTDLNAAAWYHEGVDYALSTGLMKGMGNGIFAPNTAVTRGMIVTMLYRLAGEPEVKATAPFTDVAARAYYAEAVAWAYENKIVLGVTDTRFAPEAPATREQVAAILYRYAQFAGMDVSARGSLADFSDGQTVSAYAKAPMAWAVGSGLLVGDGGRLLPGHTATRAQLATIFFRFLEK